MYCYEAYIDIRALNICMPIWWALVPWLNRECKFCSVSVKKYHQTIKLRIQWKLTIWCIHLSLFLLVELKSIVLYVQSLECPLLILFLRRQDNFRSLGVFEALSWVRKFVFRVQSCKMKFLNKCVIFNSVYHWRRFI